MGGETPSCSVRARTDTTGSLWNCLGPPPPLWLRKAQEMRQRLAESHAGAGSCRLWPASKAAGVDENIPAATQSPSRPFESCEGRKDLITLKVGLRGLHGDSSREPGRSIKDQTDGLTLLKLCMHNHHLQEYSR